jgi:hypothetical protein
MLKGILLGLVFVMMVAVEPIVNGLFTLGIYGVIIPFVLCIFVIVGAIFYRSGSN